MFDYTQTLWLPEYSMDKAIEFFFTHPKVLDGLYGSQRWKIHGWKDSKLKINYRYSLDHLPSTLRTFLHGTDIDGSFKAKKIKDSPDHIIITSKVKPKLFIPSFVKIRSRNEFQKKDNGILITFRCTVQVYLPDPFNRICHDFIDQTVRAQYNHILTILQNHNVIYTLV